MSYDTVFGLRERVAANLDRAVATVTNGDERLLWETSFALQPSIQQTPAGAALAVSLGDWLILTCPSPILGDGTLITGARIDLRKLADDEQLAIEAIRQLAATLRQMVASKIALDNPPPLPPASLLRP
jgi:hypothetical protein